MFGLIITVKGKNYKQMFLDQQKLFWTATFGLLDILTFLIDMSAY